MKKIAYPIIDKELIGLISIGILTLIIVLLTLRHLALVKFMEGMIEALL